MAKKFIDLVKVIPLFGNLKDVARGDGKDFPGGIMQESFSRDAESRFLSLFHSAAFR